MLTELCKYLRNWFDETPAKDRLPYWEGEFTISSGVLVGFSDRLLNGQYFRISGSLLNDGVWKYPPKTTNPADLKDETFTGIVQSMAIPPDVVALDAEISEWRTANAAALNSPYQSESFGGYSYSLKSGSASAGVIGGVSWQNQFAARLSPWRKI